MSRRGWRGRHAGHRHGRHRPAGWADAAVQRDQFRRRGPHAVSRRRPGGVQAAPRRRPGGNGCDRGQHPIADRQPDGGRCGYAQRCAGAIRAALDAPLVRQRYAGTAANNPGLFLADAQGFVRSEITAWAEVVRASGARPE